MLLMAAIATTLFLGGYHLPFVDILNGTGFWVNFLQVCVFLAKAYFLIFLMIWMRWTFPRVRFDQLMNFCWKFLIPVSMINLAVTAVALKFGELF